MSLDQTFLGRVYPPTEPYAVGREKIREFADAIGDENPVYRDAEAAKALGHPDVIAPPTFLMLLTLKADGQVVFDERLGLDFSRVVHRGQRFSYQRPVRADDLLTVLVKVAQLDTVDGNDVVTLQDEIRGATGELVCTATTTFVARADEAGDERTAGGRP
ncbi:MaoC family dehydratase N-terminal domain-containing protein [Goodfellowiella coeruleoviolacea]|uniref:UPF0336 protein LX83_000943 n=1 Tax=Goodfellowiella coeruleoviolacea TaxID=334858 RepID=A0AAE3GA83_9PSEU|nr:MaoC family dehydratase N-terminal domain-containing protein [Goodfellowiella coeruleoviolacea]MCP2164103.1 Acyl dehydratase [Goodfellowiella coeruleoviolacea]